MKLTFLGLTSFMSLFIAALSASGANRVEIKWIFEAPREFSTPAIKGERLFVGCDDGNVYAMDIHTGQKIWEFKTGGPVRSAPAIAEDDTIYVGSFDHKIYGINGANGTKRWELKTGWMVTSSPAIGPDGTVYVGSQDNRFYALNGETGEKKWEYDTARPIYSSPAVGLDGTVFFGSNNSNVYAFNGASGRMKWVFEAGSLVLSSPALGSDGTLYIGSYDSGIYALDSATGSKKWQTPSDTVFSSPIIGPDKTIYVSSAFVGLLALEGASGKRKWEFRALSVPNGNSPAIGADGTIYFGAGSGLPESHFYALDSGTGTLKWQYDMFPYEISSSPAIGPDGTVFVGSTAPRQWWGDFARLYAFKTSSTGGLAHSSWPNFRGNARNTGQGTFPPRILSFPTSGVLLEGTATNLSARALAEPLPAYQWYHHDQPIPGATNSSYLIPSVSTNHSGIYRLIITNHLGMAFSASATFGVHNAPAYQFVALTLLSSGEAPMELQYTDSLHQPISWFPLTNLIMTANPLTYVDFTTTNRPQRFYRTPRPERLEASIVHGWNFTAPAGNRFRIDYTDAELGYTNWRFVTNLTLTSSPQLYIDSTVNAWPRHYRISESVNQ